jgi:uncharacterized protein (TIGR03663 family)
MERDAESKVNFWDRPVLAGLPLPRRTIVLALIVGALIFTRLWDLGNRGFGHDESIHAWEAWKLVTGQGYRHDPVYHGPFGYHLVAFFYLLFGIGEVQARLGSALFGVILVLLVPLLKRWMGKAGSWFAAFLLTISPTMMIRSRYFRHDIWLMVGFVVITICIFKYLDDRRPRWMYIMAGALSVALCAKSITFIDGAIFGSFLVLYFGYEWFRTQRPLRELPIFDLVLVMGTLALPWASAFLIKVFKGDPLDYSQSGMVRSGIVVMCLIVLSAMAGIWWNRKVWLVSAGIFYSIFLVFYTSLFTNAQGAATGIVGMLGYWLSQQGVRRGSQPWYYFGFLTFMYEYLPALMSILGTAYFAGKGLRASGSKEKVSKMPALCAPAWLMPAFLIYWNVLNWLVWTWVGEKMPWQNMHLVLPMGLLGGWFLGQMWDRTDWARFRREGALSTWVWLPVAVFSLLVLAITTGQKPFAGMSLEQLQVTLRWLLALGLLGIAVAFLVRFGRGLSWNGWSRVLLGVVFVALSITTFRAAWMASFINQDYATEFLVYADSTPDTAAVMTELDALSARVAGDKDLRVAYDDESSWPFVWLLRDYHNASFFAGSSSVASDAQVVIVGPENESKVKGQLSTRYYRRQYRLIWWPNQDLYSGYTPSKILSDLKDPARRSFWWDIWWYRKYATPTTSWPYVHNFALYVRKDIASQIWNYGPEVVASTEALPEDEYAKKQVEAKAIATWGSYGSGDGQFNYPKGIAVDSQGRIYVADSINHRVQVLDATGKVVLKIGSEGNAPGQFREPWSVAVDGKGFIYVADTWNHRIQKFDSGGEFVTQWGTFGDTSGDLGDSNSLYGPRDVRVDAEGNVLVSDTGNKRILKFSSDGKFLTQFGGAGSLNGQFREPVGIAIDGNGNLLVADTWNQRIQKFDPLFNPAGAWEVLGWESEGVVNKPYVAVDSQGNVYATAPEYHRVVKFNAAGKVQAVWGQYGSDSGSLNMPVGIAVDSSNNVYVADSANHRVLKFAPIP